MSNFKKYKLSGVSSDFSRSTKISKYPPTQTEADAWLEWLRKLSDKNKNKKESENKDSSLGNDIANRVIGSK